MSPRHRKKVLAELSSTEAAWELLGEAVEPFFEEMRRHIELGIETAAAGTCSGIVLGLYRCRGQQAEQLVGWAEDFPMETAGHAVATLASQSRAKHRRAWRLPGAIVGQVPKWAGLFGRPPKDSVRRRARR